VSSGSTEGLISDATGAVSAVDLGPRGNMGTTLPLTVPALEIATNKFDTFKHNRQLLMHSPTNSQRLARCDNDPTTPPFVGACWGPTCPNKQPDMSPNKPPRTGCSLKQRVPTLLGHVGENINH